MLLVEKIDKFLNEGKFNFKKYIHLRGNKMELFEKYLTEGTWNNPNTVEKAKEIEKLFKRPITAKQAEKSLYGLIGDDDFFDMLYVISQKDDEKNDDIRGSIISWLYDHWLKDLDPKTGQGKKNHWKKSWDPEAIKILMNLYKKWWK